MHINSMGDIMKEISIDNLSKFNENYLLIDVRIPSEYIKGHLKNSINMPYTNILTMLKKYPKNTIIVLYCDYGHQSSRVGRMLTGLGYNNIYILKNVKDYYE